jgi:hypothetical protein
MTRNLNYIFKQDGISAQDSKRMQDWLKENLTEERFVLLALLTATLLTILCGASLNYRSFQSFATNPMI